MGSNRRSISSLLPILQAGDAASNQENAQTGPSAPSRLRNGVAQTFLSVREQTEMSVPPQNQGLKTHYSAMADGAPTRQPHLPADCSAPISALKLIMEVN